MGVAILYNNRVALYNASAHQGIRKGQGSSEASVHNGKEILIFDFQITSGLVCWLLPQRGCLPSREPTGC